MTYFKFDIVDNYQNTEARAIFFLNITIAKNINIILTIKQTKNLFDI